MNLTVAFVLGMIADFFLSLTIEIVEPIRKKWRRECNYDCSKCKVWDCDKHLCDKQKKKDFTR